MLTAHTRELGTLEKPQFQGLVRETNQEGQFISQRTLNIVRKTKEEALKDALNEIEFETK